MNDQQILEYIATKQPVRAVQLADKFDVDLKAASDALRSLVDVGDLVRAAGTAPNGTPAQEYSISPTFLKSKEGMLLIARMEAAAAAAPAPAASQERAEAPAPAPAATAEAQASAGQPLPAALLAQLSKRGQAEHAGTTAGANRVEEAIACIKERGSVPDADLRVVMGLRAGQYPSAWLTAAVKDGRVRKDGRNWTLGDGTPPEQPKKRPPFGGPLGLAGATPHVAPMSKTIALPSDGLGDGQASGAGIEEQQEVMVARAAPKFRCGLWSDGVIELQRNGVTVLALEQGEGEALADFVGRMRTVMEPAAA